ncbi:MAG: nitroreductase family protein [Chitinispirillaceae bacterium]
MSFRDLVDKRYSVRGYQDRSVDQELIVRVLDAARNAPSAVNNQPWCFIVLRREEAKKNLKAVYDREWFLNAPVIIAVCCDRTVSWKRKDGKDYGDVDAAIAMDHITLAAADEGLGTCWIGAFSLPEALRVLKLPSYIEPIAFTPLGYPSLPQGARRRKELDEVVFWEQYGNSKP